MSMQGSAMMYVILAPSLARLPDQAFHELTDPLDERGLRHDLVETRFVSGTEATRVGVIRETEDGHVGVRVGDLVGIDPGDVGDHEVRRVDAVGRDQMMFGEERVQLAPEEEVDPTQQDRRHGARRVTLRLVIEKWLDEGLELARAGRYFDAHEAFELAWRAADDDERDFYQGLVHVVVAWYQNERENRTGFERQLVKAQRRLAPYAPEHRGVDVASVLGQVARARFGALAPLDLAEAERVEDPAQPDIEPPLAVEEEE
jgi:predicted metal-dependent hydrolase